MNNIELAVLDAIQGIRFPALDIIMKYLTHLGDAGILFIILTLLLLSIKKTRLFGLVCATALIFDLLAVNIIIKPLVARARPFTFRPDLILLIKRPLEFSFPSGHTAISFAFAMAIGAYSRKYQLWAFVLSAVIAFSRMYLYVHYPSDILAGIVIGLLCGYLARLVWRKRLNYMLNK